jgi:hypothetical protein
MTTNNQKRPRGNRAESEREVKFRLAVREFHLSNKGVDDYMKFIFAAAYVLRQGIALPTERIMEIINEEIRYYASNDAQDDGKII